MVVFSVITLISVLIPVGYFTWLLLGSIYNPTLTDEPSRVPAHFFCIAIAAHNEEAVIEKTVRMLLALDYPERLYSIHIVADHCSDQTAELARSAGANVYERQEGSRNGKSAALSWLLQHVLDEQKCDAVVIFDADTRVDKNFLRIMDARLSRGDQIIQGQHVISNPGDGWFPALTWAMFLIDNRFQNLGRANWGWSAKNMGDSICFRADILREVGWGDGLADDYQLRQKFLLHGIKINYEPAAKGFGEAALSLSQARAQRLRWIRGVYDANQQFAKPLLLKAIKTGDIALLDGALQAYLPSYSMVACYSLFLFLINFLGNKWSGYFMPPLLLGIWLTALTMLFLYPIIGLALEKAPRRAYMAIMSAPVFIIWRVWLAVVGRFGNANIIWVRTAHKG